MAVVIVILLVGLFIYYFSKKSSVKSEQKHLTIDDKYNEERVNNEKELNRLLEKINKKGIDSLSKKERNRLDKLSK